jgi:hypothetical protein
VSLKLHVYIENAGNTGYRVNNTKSGWIASDLMSFEGAATKRWILQQLHSKTVHANIGAHNTTHNRYMKSLEFYETTSLFFVWKKTNFLTMSY